MFTKYQLKYFILVTAESAQSRPEFIAACLKVFPTANESTLGVIWDTREVILADLKAEGTISSSKQGEGGPIEKLKIGEGLSPEKMDLLAEKADIVLRKTDEMLVGTRLISILLTILFVLLGMMMTLIQR